MIAAAIVARRPARDTGFFSKSFCDDLEAPGIDAPWPAAPPLGREAWRQAAARDTRPALSAETFDAWRQALVRLGAPGPALAAWDSLASGRAVAVVAGQQPDFLGGPLYTLYKAATVVAAARRLSRDGRPAVPVFWVATEDSDFEEVRHARLLTGALEAVEISVAREACPRDGFVGGVPAAALQAAWAAAESALGTAAAGALARRWLGVVRAAATDLGEAQAAWLLRAFGESGLVPFDPRLPAFRRDAQPIYDRYLAHHAAVAHRVDEAGARLEARGVERPIPPLTSAFALYEIQDGTRQKSGPEAARRALAAGRPLTGNVVLRAVTQDALFASALHVVGPGEAAYLGQLGAAYERLGVAPPVRLPRLSATWIPAPAWHWMRGESRVRWEWVQDPDAVVRDLVRRRLPAALVERLDAVRDRLGGDLRDLGEASREVDASLPQLVESVRSKMDYQVGRLYEGMLAKVRSRLDRAHPELPRLRQALRPQDRPQERKIGWLSLVAEAEERTAPLVLALAEEHLQSLECGRFEHFLFPTEEGAA